MIYLRPATDADYDVLYALHVAAMRDAVDATWGWDDAFQARHFRERWNPQGRQILTVDGEDVGVLALSSGDAERFLSLIEIHPRYQGRGIGTRVIRGAIADAHGDGVPVSLHVLKANLRARALYARLGFVVTEERAERYVMTCPPPRP